MASGGKESDLTYGNLTLEDLVNKDTDGDGIPDWQEVLYGLDPTKKETTPGIPDSLAIKKLRVEAAQNESESYKLSLENEEDLNKTGRFARELFATIAALNQSGSMDQATIDALGASLALQIQNSEPKKIYSPEDIRITDDESQEAARKYETALFGIYGRHNTAREVPDILAELVANEENLSVLSELDAVVNQIGKITNELLETTVPRSIAPLHLNLINISQKLKENISNLQLLESDPIMSIGAISQYWENSLELELIATKLAQIIQQKRTQ